MSAHASSPSTADRNLLFGILALQMDFIDRDALVAAMNAWVLQKATPLGQVLLDQGAIQADTRALLDALVQKHLEMHGGDAQQSLAAVNPLGSVREQLERIADPDLYATLGHVSSTRNGDEADPFATRASAPGDPALPRPRFRILRPHARGGLGEVFVARDEELHREVALKEIQGRYADDLNSRARFVLEAEVTGGLEHPGIVPVYGLGTYTDGRPYYAMRFIQGDSLQETIARFHSAEESKRDPGERTLALRQLLGRFVAVCDAIAYAHSRGVLHRDLKPSNIMLGPYGETLVVDWGLAKALGDRMETTNGTTAQQPLKPTLSDSAVPTLVGSAVGTPTYMPPEQAAGRVDRLGPASDVYSLGATLYCLLTGKPPFQGTDVGEILRRVQYGEFPSPRTVKPEVPAALEAICRKAMALRPEDRYASPLALAADVECWLADEPVSAWREPWRFRVGRWARRHRTLMATAATAVLLTMLAALVGAWWLGHEHAAQQHAVESALEDVADLQAQGRWEEARAVLGQAKNRLGAGGPQDLHDKLERAQAELDFVARLDEIRLRRATLIEGHFDTAGADRHFEQAFREAGLGEVGSDAAAAAAWVTASGVRDALIAALDVWAACAQGKERRAWLVDVARQVACDPWRDSVQDPKTWNDPDALACLVATDEAARQSPHLLCVIGMRLRKLKGDAEPILRLAQQRYPKDFWINLHLANVLRAKGKRAEGIGFRRAALALRPATAVVHLGLSSDLIELGRWEEALTESQKASELEPRDALAHNDLGRILHHKGQVDKAIAEYHKALDLDPKCVHAHNNLGNALRAKRQVDEAIAAYHKTIELDPKYAFAHNNLGNALRDKGRLEEAIAEYHKAIESDPKYVNAYNNLGNALRDKGQLDEAIAEYHKASEIDPQVALSHYNLGLALAKKGRQDEAIAAFHKASALNPRDAHICADLGYALSQRGRRNEAIAEYRKAIKLDSRYARVHNNLGADLRETGYVDEAIAECNKAIELNPKYALAHYGLGLCLADKDDLDAAIPVLRKGMELDPKNANIRRNFANVLKRHGDLEEATIQFRRAVELDPKNTFGQEQLACCQRMLALDKKSASILKGDTSLANPSEQLDFAELCLWRQRPIAAVRFYQAAFAARPQLAEDSKAYRYDAIVAAARAAAGRGKDVENLSAEERASYHRQAIRWLRDHLAMRAKQIEHGTLQEKVYAQKKLRLWQCRAEFAVLRDAAIWEKLPDAERAECRKLWDEVAALVKR